MEKSRKDLAEYRLAKAKEHLKSAEYLFQKDCFMDSTIQEIEKKIEEIV